MHELWAHISGFPNYAVSNYGNVKNVRIGNQLSPRTDSYGYLRVVLRRDGKSYSKLVHRLVAQAFVTGYREDRTIKHHDGDNGNNIVDNLRFRANKGLGVFIMPKEDVAVRRVRIVETGHVFRTVRECARHIDGDPSSIYKVLRGERPSHKEFTFEYFEG